MTGTKTGPMLRQADEGADQIALVGPEDEFGGAGNGRRRDPERIGFMSLVQSRDITYERLPMLEVVFDRLERMLTTSVRNFTSESLTRNELSDFNRLWLVGVASNDGATRCRGLKSPGTSIGATG